MSAEFTLQDLFVMLLWTGAAGYALGWVRGWSTGVRDEKKRLVHSIMSKDAGE